MTGPCLALEAVSYRYDDRNVVDSVSLAVEPGQFIGLLGPNGAGKSTLLRLAAGLAHPHAGRVTYAGRDLRTLKQGDVARQVALLPQTGVLPPSFTGWEVALMGRTPHLGWFASEGPRDISVARQALEQADALSYADRRTHELSGGERQRLLLARALAQEPAVLLLDEPTTHLDLAHQVALLDLLSRLARQQELGVLAVFHDLNLAATYADHLVLLVDGRTRATGTPAEVVQPAVLWSVFGVDLIVQEHPTTGRPVVLLSGPAMNVKDSNTAPSIAKPEPETSGTRGR